MKAMIIGAGKIGRGFIAQLLRENNIDLFFAEKSQELVDALNDIGSYTSHILGEEEKSTVIDSYQAFQLENVKELANAWEVCSLIFTSVGGKNLVSVGKVMADAFKKRLENGPVEKSTIITCENWKNPASDLKEAILSRLTQEEKQEFEEKISVTEAVIMRVAVNPSDEQLNSCPLDTWSHDYWELPINRANWKTEPPELKYFKYLNHFGRFLDQKLYTNNASNAAVAYYGYLKHFIYTADAANDPEVEKLMDAVYDEVNEMIVKEMGVTMEDQMAFAKKAKDKYQNKAIVDKLTRHAADPIRKIGPNDRLVAPARLCLKHGIRPDAIAFVLAAALYFDNPEDPSAMKLKELRKKKGIPYILEHISELSPEEPLYQMVLDQVELLKRESLVKDE
ncbi:MAG: mannitol dehydrogenase [Bacillus sp. (in: firmicutes)]